MHRHGTDDQRVGEQTTDDRLDGDEVYCPTCNGSFSPLVDHCPDDGTRLIRWHAARDPLIGSVVDGRFRVVRALGEGGMGVVYEAIQLAVDRAVALKVIREPLARDRSAAKRFLREARLLTGFNHPNIVHVFDYGQTASGALYLVMELLRGDTLADELEAARRIAPRRVCELAIQLCDALAAAHARGIIHRDLKPTNIVVLATPVPDLVKVLDFGLAKSLTGEDVGATTLTQAGAILGTPRYMAPEAIAGAADARTDLYALGCILYELVAGAAPFVDSAVNVVIARQLTEPPPPLPADVPAALARVIGDLLAKAPGDRPASAGEVRARLEAFLDDEDDDGSGYTEDIPTLIHEGAPRWPPPPDRSTIRGLPPVVTPTPPAFGSQPPRPVARGTAPAPPPPRPRPADRTSMMAPAWTRLEIAALVIGALMLLALIVVLAWLVA